MERDYDASSAVYGSDLEGAAAVGKRAGEKAVRRLNPRKIKTTKAPVYPAALGRKHEFALPAIVGKKLLKRLDFIGSKRVNIWPHTIRRRKAECGANASPGPARCRALD